MNLDDARFAISNFDSQTDTFPKRTVVTWSDLCKMFDNPLHRLEKDGPLFSPAIFDPAKRSNKNVTELSLLCYDIDHNADINVIHEQLDGLNCAYIVGSTHSHLRKTENNPDAEPRYRILIPLRDPVIRESFSQLWQDVRTRLQLPIDASTKDASRMYYKPVRVNQGLPYYIKIVDGKLFEWTPQSVTPAPTSERIENGSRNATLTSLAGRLRRQGCDEQTIYHELQSENTRKCDPPLDLSEVAAIAKSVSRYEPAPDAEDNSYTQLRRHPEPDEKCFNGLAGDFVRLVAPNSEADPMALLSQFLVYFGNVVGRSPFIRIESDRHNTNLFCILVGATGSGRKGTSFRRVKDVFKGIDIDHEAGCHASGLASGEGLVWRVRDASAERKKGTEIVVDDPGIIDKRLLVVEGEFVQVLRVQGREGNTLSGSIRNLWDTGTVQNLTKNSPIKTTDAHVSIIGHITADELHHTLTAVEGANGYANRFLFVAVRRGKFLPFGGELSEYEVAQLRSRIGEAVRFGKSVGQMKLTSSARDIWVREYERLETSRHGYLAKITQRASPYTLRLACIYALLDQSSAIDAVHLESALAFWKYAEDSARYIFGESLGNETAETILTALKETEGGLSRTAIRDLFDRHISKSRLDAALQSLLESNLAHFETQNTGGRKRETWFASSHLNQ